MIHKVKKTAIVRRLMMYIAALVLLTGHPFAAMASAQEPTATPTTTTETAPAEEEPELTYTFNKETGRWDSEKWQYNPATNTYEKPPAPVIVEPKNTVDKEVDTNVTIDNNVQSDATSGNAQVSGNTTGGSATSGDAASVATLLNTVNSTITTGENGKVASFTQDILGDVKGDIILHPMLLKAMLEAQANPEASTNIDVKNNLQVNNNLDINATSGDAEVSGNTTGGDATSGSAHAVANVVNILNSMIATQQSFIGTINIYGNLEGDILIAPDFIPQMIANNGDNGENESDIQVSNQDTQTIVNNISAAAESGAASVFGNTNGGDAKSGNAESNVVIFNLSGHEVVAKNSLLVFVNVLGRWVGVIVDAPEGATAAMLSNGVSSHEYQPDLTLNSESEQGITNTISVNAQSGSASVNNNTTGGNATSGDAKAAANVANVTGNQFAASDWFGVLFINVFQDWFGSFGVDTEYGNEPDNEETVNTPPVPTGPIEFVPTVEETNRNNTARLVVIDTRSLPPVDTTQQQPEAIDTTIPEVEQTTDQAQEVLGEETVTEPADYRLWIAAGSILLIGAAAIGLRYLFA